MFIPLIVVNCIVLGPGGGVCSKNGVLASAVDGLCQGIGYTLALITVCVIRELLGSGTFGGGILNGGEGIRIIPLRIPPCRWSCLWRLPRAGLCHCRVPVACKASGNEE